MRHRIGRVLAAVLALLVALASLPPGAWAEKPSGGHGRVDRYLREKAAREPHARVPVLIQRTNRGAARNAVAAHGGTVRREASVGNMVAAEVPASWLEALAREPGVLRVSYDAPVVSLAPGGNGKGNGNANGHGHKPPTAAGTAVPTSTPTTTPAPSGTPTAPGTPTSTPTSTLTATPIQTVTPKSISEDRLQTVYPFALDAPQLWKAGVVGSGVTVAVLDSGLRDHPDFLDGTGTQSRVLRKVAIATDAAGGPNDDNGHGTFVAGVVGGQGWGAPETSLDDNAYLGTAPNVNLVSVKVSDRYGRARVSDVIAGIEWVIDNKDAYNIRVINLSLVSSMAESYKTSLLSAAVEMAWLKGIVVVVSAGNAGPDTMYYPPANDPFVIVVGAADDMGTRDVADDRRASFSSYGVTQDGFAKPDLVAPGRRIVSTLSKRDDPLGLRFPDRIVDGNYIRLSGTSAAAPAISGVVAQLLDGFRLLKEQGYAPADARLTPDQVKWLLTHTARPLAEAGTGAGYPSAVNAASYLYSSYRNDGGVSIGRAGRGLVPNNYVAMAGLNALVAAGAVSWDAVSWDAVSWDAVSWDAVSWDAVSWDNVSWDAVSWDAAADGPDLDG
ncbi:MAG TPA: S8 family peptidase [Chloroflexota bacterium]|nr:S8 family peptidase [Chloroflexota bacterium]